MEWFRKNDGDNGKSKSAFILRSDRGMGSHRSEQSADLQGTKYPTEIARESQEKSYGFDEQQQTKSNSKSDSFYPTVIDSNPDRDSVFSEPTKPNFLYSNIYSEPPGHRPSVSLYPSVHMGDLVENRTDLSAEMNKSSEQSNAHEGFRLYPEVPTGKTLEQDIDFSSSTPLEATEEILIKIPGAVVHLIDKEDSVELASGEFILVRLVQRGNGIAVFARIGDEIQWPLAKDEAAVKLDECHYFFSLRVPSEAYHGDSSDEENLTAPTDIAENILNYGLTFAARGQASLLQELDKHLDQYSYFSVQKVSDKRSGPSSSPLDDSLPKETAPSELSSGEKKQLIEERSAAYWTTLAPNVEDYSGSVARAIAAGSGQLIKGLLWCGDVTVEQLKWGNDFLKKRLQPNEKASEISPEALRRMRRAKRVSRMSEKVVKGVLSGAVKVAGFVTGSVVNSKAGKKFFSLLPGEIILASLDAFGKVFDAVEVVGKNVLTTSSVVTTGLVSHRYGEQAAEFTNEGLGAAGHMISTAWTISKIRNALNPKSVLKPTTLAKSAAKSVKKDKQSK